MYSPPRDASCTSPLAGLSGIQSVISKTLCRLLYEDALPKFHFLFRTMDSSSAQIQAKSKFVLSFTGFDPE
jgi:hypothetical protein